MERALEGQRHYEQPARRPGGEIGTGLTWIVEHSFAWLWRNRRLSKDYEY
jgi:hypothetical protein